MLERKNRLLSEKDFSRLFAKGKSFGGCGIGLKVGMNQKGQPRIGFVVSTKVAKHAVDRNRIKRRLREILRPLVGRIEPKNVDLSFMARSEAVKMEFAELRVSVLALLEKSGLVSKKPPQHG